MEKVQLHIKNYQAWITINRPEKRNAIDYDVMDELKEKLQHVASNDEVKVVIITGKGEEAFCSGGDLSVFHSIYTKVEAEKMLNKMAAVLEYLFFFPKPTIAYLNGTAVGGGCEIATACDYRIASKNVKLGFIQGRLGITTGWGGSSYLFERINSNQAFEWLLSARTFSALEAIPSNFVHGIFDQKRFNEWLNHITVQPLSVIKAYKNRCLSKYDRQLMKEKVAKEIDECSTLWESDDHHQAVAKFVKK